MYLRLSEEGYKLLRYYEQGPKGGPALLPYRCPAGKWTNGFGHTGADVVPGKAITIEKAEANLHLDVQQFERDVNELVKVPLTQGQFDALVLFAFNVGSDIDDDDIAEGLGDSTLLKLVNRNDFAKAALEFAKWVNATVNGKRIKLAGLIKRREAERIIFTTGKFVPV